jgi:DNA-directed RNA polymerase subunit RPC12/RpoP
VSSEQQFDPEVAEPMSESSTDSHVLDGNVLGGLLSEIFTVDATLAVAKCANCGWSDVLAKTRVYVSTGMVVRCPACGSELMTVVRTPRDTSLHLSGLVSLRISYIPEA